MQPAEAVEGIILDLSELKELWVNNEAFVGMKRLKLLQLTDNFWFSIKQHVSGDLKSLSNELRVLVWHEWPLKSLPSEFQPKNLIKIVMPHSRIEQLWEGTKPLPDLVHMDLSGSTDLIKIPDLTEATTLKRLNLEGCTSLLEVHPSISALESLVELNLEGGSNLVKFPYISGNMKELTILRLDETSITEMPSSINDLPGLEYLSLCKCIELRSLPSNIHMKSLIELVLSGCSKLEKFPEISKVMEKLIELIELNLDGTAVKELPSSINNLTGLEHLGMRNCTTLVSLPDEICDLARLRDLDLIGCSKLSKLPDNFQNWESLGKFGLRNLEGIKQLPFCISRWESLSCKGWKDLTAPFSSWPTTCINPSCSILVHLDLSDCNLLELSDAIAHLSRLQTLRPSRNSNLESLPAAMNRLPHLRELHLEDCKRLESIPELSSSIEYISADDCTTLVTVPTLQFQCVGIISFTFLKSVAIGTSRFAQCTSTCFDLLDYKYNLIQNDNNRH